MTHIATFNVNGVNGRLPVLLRWLDETKYDIVCLQELKTSDEKFPLEAISNAGYGAIWHGQRSYNGVAILARGTDPVERRRGLPGDPDDTHSRYIEADVNGLVVGCLYLPNGNPAPGSKFDYKLGWFERLISYGCRCLKPVGQPSSAAIIMWFRPHVMRSCQGDGSAMLCTSLKAGTPTAGCSRKDGSMPFVILIQRAPSTPTGTSPIAADMTEVQDFEWTTFW